jgi:UPF0755 protein
MIETEQAIHFTEKKPVVRKLLFLIVLFSVISVAVVFLLFKYQNTATADFPIGTEVIIEEGESIDAISEKLEDSKYIHSPFLFKLLARHTGTDTSIQAGTYTFSEPHSTFELIQRLSLGASEPRFRITFPEGYSVHDWNIYTDGLFQNALTSELQNHEGVLFPDTYFVAHDESLESLIERMREHYEETVQPLRPLMKERGYTEEEVIIFASILEREANDETSMRTVAGILENRLTNDMPLQVDAVFEYYTGKGSDELSVDDLQTDTAYNTYTNIGLPPEPIGNPGLMAISAVLNPIPSDYYYYLTGNDGKFYYAKTFEEHKRNKARYLR